MTTEELLHHRLSGPTDAPALMLVHPMGAALVAGRHDLLLPPALAETVRDLLPAGAARLEIDEEGAHFLPYQRPAHFGLRVLDFLDGVTF